MRPRYSEGLVVPFECSPGSAFQGVIDKEAVGIRLSFGLARPVVLPSFPFYPPRLRQLHDGNRQRTENGFRFICHVHFRDSRSMVALVGPLLGLGYFLIACYPPMLGCVLSKRANFCRICQGYGLL